MRIRGRTDNRARFVLGTALSAAGLLGAAWAADARRRGYRTAVLHRSLVDLLLNAMSAGDPVTERHCRRVADLTDALADCYGFRGERRSRLRIAALLHDMGKIEDQFFPILHSCEPLTGEERQKIEEHPREGADILRPLEKVHPGISPIVESHHECWDGAGYPRKLRGEEIPLEARMISAADVFDAMTQPRSYHDPLSIEEVLDKIREAAGSRFDPDVVRRLDHRSVRNRWREIAMQGRLSEQQSRAQSQEAKVSG